MTHHFDLSHACNRSMKELFLSVIIPSYDEMANLQKGVLDEVVGFLEKKKYQYEVLIVDDGSQDGSVEFVKQFAKKNKHVKLLANPHLGKAGAVTRGMLVGQGKYILFTDMDQATPIAEVDKLLPFVEHEYDVAIGSRSSGEEGYPVSRLIMHTGMIMLRKILVGLSGIQDTQCGFKLFKQDVAHTLFQKMSELHHGYRAIKGSKVTAGFDVELLHIASVMGYKIKEVPVKWRYVQTRRVNPINDSIDGLMGLLTIRKNELSGKYTFRK